MTTGLAAAAAIVAASTLARAGERALAADDWAAATSATRAFRRLDRAQARAAAIFLLSVVALGAGAVWAGSHWPGSGGHPWSDRDIAPAGIARVAWALTAWVSSYWAHPGQLLALSAPLLSWMIICPLLLGAACASARSLRRRGPQRVTSRRTLVAAKGLFTAGAILWLVGGSPGPNDLYGAGAIDVLLVGVLASEIARMWAASMPDARATT